MPCNGDGDMFLTLTALATCFYRLPHKLTLLACPPVFVVLSNLDHKC